MSTARHERRHAVGADHPGAGDEAVSNTAVAPASSRSRRRSRIEKRRLRRKNRRTVVGRHPVLSAILVVIVALTPVWVSLGSALSSPALGSSFGSRFAEWAREHGASPVVNWAENLWYTHHAPPVGGAPAKGTIPAPAATSATPVAAAGPAHLPVPAPITPFASPPIPGEGTWHPAGRRVDGLPAIYEAFLRPDPVHTSLVAGVAWMDTKLLRATLYSGSTIPGGGPYPDTAPVSSTAARSLVAAFNSGFLMSNAQGGYYTDGRSILPLRNGAASFVVYRNGTATIADWGREARMGSNIVSVRQNLNLLVDGAKPVPGLDANDTTQWGFTVGNAVYVWRSGIGVTADGALVYVAGPGLNITTLADLLVRAGAVRAMELDINTDWVNLSTYAPSSSTGAATPANGSLLLSDMTGTTSRYFESWWARDFITMSARTSG